MTRPGASVFCADGGLSQGFGDVSSFLRLARAVEDSAGIRAVFLTGRDKRVVDVLSAAGFELELLPVAKGDPRFVPLLTRSLDRLRPAVLVSYSLGKSLDEIDLLRMGARSLCLVLGGETPNAARRRAVASRADVVIDWDIDACPIEFEEAPAPHWLIGPAYCLVGGGLQIGPLLPKGEREDVRHVLVSMGGSDLRNLTPQIIRALDLIEGPLEVTVVVGPAFENRREVEAAAAASRHTCRLLPGVLDLLPTMAEADLAISTGGLTLFELAAVGTPTLAVSVVDHQRPRVARFASAGVCVDLGWHAEITPEGVRRKIVEVIACPALRRCMSESGQRLVDGQGVRRVAEAIVGAVARHA